MGSLKTDFYVKRSYIVRGKSMLGDSFVLGSVHDDTEAGRSQCEALCKRLQEANDKEQSEKNKKRRK